VVEFAFDPGPNDSLNVGEIDQHPPIVKLQSLERDDRPAVVTVQVFAFSLVIQQPMAITKVELLSHTEHESARSSKFLGSEVSIAKRALS
jgi:hypothetical protein